MPLTIRTDRAIRHYHDAIREVGMLLPSATEQERKMLEDIITSTKLTISKLRGRYTQ